MNLPVGLPLDPDLARIGQPRVAAGDPDHLQQVEILPLGKAIRAGVLHLAEHGEEALGLLGDGDRHLRVDEEPRLEPIVDEARGLLDGLAAQRDLADEREDDPPVFRDAHRRIEVGLLEHFDLHELARHQHMTRGRRRGGDRLLFRRGLAEGERWRTSEME